MAMETSRPVFPETLARAECQTSVRSLYGTIAAHVVVRFGTYEVSVELGEVRKTGVKIRIQHQPLKLLEVLLERPAEVVNEGNCAAESRPSTSQLIITSWLVRRRAALVF